jgi:hypothetical protein
MQAGVLQATTPPMAPSMVPPLTRPAVVAALGVMETVQEGIEE